MSNDLQAVSLERVRYRTLIASMLFALVGLLALIVCVQLQEGFVSSLLRELTTLCLVGGALSAIYELYQRRDYLAAADAGVTRVLERINEVDRGVIDRLKL